MDGVEVMAWTPQTISTVEKKMKTRSLEPSSVRAEHGFLYEKVIHRTVLGIHVS